MDSHEIDYEVYGDDMQFVEIELDPNETVIAEAGAMMMMSPSIQMETIFGDGSSSSGGGFMDKIFGAGKRVLTGESLFMTAYTNTGYGKSKVAFASPYPGKIIPITRQIKRFITNIMRVTAIPGLTANIAGDIFVAMSWLFQ